MLALVKGRKGRTTGRTRTIIFDFFWGGGEIQTGTVQEFFSAQANKTDFFSCKSAAQDIFSPIHFAAGYFFVSYMQ